MFCPIGGPVFSSVRLGVGCSVPGPVFCPIGFLQVSMDAGLFS